MVDGVATVDEQREFEEDLKSDPDLEKEYRSFKHIKEVTDTIKFKEPPDSYWEEYWTNIYNRLERGTGWIFFSIGAIILLAFSGYQLFRAFFLSSSVPLIAKAGVAFGAFGIIILFVSIIREVIFARRHERYKEVKY